MPRLLQDPLREFLNSMGRVRSEVVRADTFSISSQVDGMNLTAFRPNDRAADLAVGSLH